MLTTDKQTVVDVHVTDTQGQPFYVQDVPVILYSRWLMRWIPANYLQIVAWVTPDDPIELTNLLASAVERIGLHAEIVIIPGHAFLGIATTRDNKSFEYWDAVDMNNNIAADSANVHADAVYRQHARAHTLVETILVSDARNAHVGPML